MPRDKRGEKPEWYPLDNAGVLYSALQKEKYSAIYRFSAVMAERVDRDALQRAVDKTMPRFPSFGVRIKFPLTWLPEHTKLTNSRGAHACPARGACRARSTWRA